MSRHGRRRAAARRDAEPPVARELFPMMVVTAEVVLALPLLRPFQELLKHGLVKRLAPKAVATFVSHQWLARSHPDPLGVQLQTLQRFLRTAGRGLVKGLFSERDWTAFKSAVNHREGRASVGSDLVFRGEVTDLFSRWGPDAPDEVLSEELANSFLWIDYISVPQDVAPGDDSQSRAIQSIPYYVMHSSFFLIVCPSAKCSIADDFRAYQAWLQRGWCRFEVWANVLSHQRVVPLVLTDTHVWTIAIDDFLFTYGIARGAVVGCGEFSCCHFGHKRIDGTTIPCDQDRILPLLENMWCSRVCEASEAQMPWMYASLRIWETQFFARSRDAPFHATWGQGSKDDATPKLVLDRIEADIQAGRVPQGYNAVGIAAELGDERLLKACAARGDDLMAVDPDGDTVLSLACIPGSLAAVEYLLSLPSMTVEHVNLSRSNGRTALHQSVRNERIVRALLRFRAHPTPCLQGTTPLHVAARRGYDGAVRMLLASGETSVDAVDVSGMTALHHAAEGKGLFSSVQGRLLAMQCLLRHGASTTILDCNGATASDSALRNGFPDAVDLLQAGTRRD